MLPSDDPRVVRLTDVVRAGDTAALAALLAEHPEVAVERHGDDECSRTALHVATDWPGNFPNVAHAIELMAAAGAPVDGRFHGPHRETPLHWAASSNDVPAIDALLDAGADLEADGAVFTNGSPLSDAVVFAQMDAARRLVARGARMTIWQAAALDEVSAVRASAAGASAADITNACWHACRAGAIGAVRLLVERGADLDWLGYDDLTCRAAARQSGNADLVAFVDAH